MSKAHPYLADKGPCERGSERTVLWVEHFSHGRQELGSPVLSHHLLISVNPDMGLSWLLGIPHPKVQGL